MSRPTRDLAAAFREHWERHFALPEGSRVVVAVSGGIDSMVLLRLLARHDPAGLVAAHFDHGTRGEESAADGEFVAGVAERWGVEVRLGRGDAPALAEEAGHGPMAAARALRYAFLLEAAADAEAGAIVTAHHQDDRVETALLRIVRGTGVDGLGGLRPIESLEGVALLRPLLPFSRAAIEGWAEAAGVPYRDDPSNRTERYPRARIRSEVLPLLRRLNPRVDEAIVRLSGLAAADAAWLNERAGAHLEAATVARTADAWSFSAAELIGAPQPILSRALLAAWAWSAPADSPPPGAAWTGGAMEFLRGGRGGRLPCPGGGELRRAGSRIEIRRAGAAGPADANAVEEEHGGDDGTGEP